MLLFAAILNFTFLSDAVFAKPISFVVTEKPVVKNWLVKFPRAMDPLIAEYVTGNGAVVESLSINISDSKPNACLVNIKVNYKRGEAWTFSGTNHSFLFRTTVSTEKPCDQRISTSTMTWSE